MRALDKVISSGIFREKFLLFLNSMSWSKACDLEVLLNVFIDSMQIIKYIFNLS